MPQHPLSTFADELARLNPRQREAVDAIEGPVMVVAGPGTGKTQILTLRIANILARTDTPADAVLALTFTEAGVHAMRKRLAESIGSRAYAVSIGTFHGFCNGIIQRYPEAFPRIIGSTHISEVEQVDLIEDIIGEGDFTLLKPFGDPLYYVRDAARTINTLKREGVAPDDFGGAVKEAQERFDAIPDLVHQKGAHKGKMKGAYQDLQKRIAKNRELCAVYRAYEERLAEKRLYDYSDMIMEVLRALTNDANLLLILQEQYHYLLVDEHQDTNNAQNRILERLASYHKNPNLFVVGDEKQAIFRFQGASLENFFYFKKLYPSARLITLEENYRSAQTVLDAAHGVAHLISEKAPRLTAKGADAAHNTKIRTFAFSRAEVEQAFLATDIAEAIKAGETPDDIAVLYRDNRDAFPVARALEKAGIPFALESEQDLLLDPELRKLIVILKAVSAFGEPGPFLEALHVDALGVHPLDIYALIAKARAANLSPYDVLRTPARLAEVSLEAPAALTDAFARLTRWATAAKNERLPELVERVVRESGILAKVLARSDAAEALAALGAFADEVNDLMERHRTFALPDLLGYLELLEKHGMRMTRSLVRRAGGRVRLMTAHKSKGQEFGRVYIVGAYDGHWGGRVHRDALALIPEAFSLTGEAVPESTEDDDERRLFYVALTRAKRTATLSYAALGADGRAQLPSRFLAELKSELVEPGDPASAEAAVEAHPEARWAEGAPGTEGLKNRELIREAFLKNGLSVSALNNYLACPWKYFYQNLFRIPKAPERHQLYGIAIHAALKDFFDAYRITGRDTPTRETLLARFAWHLARQPLGERDHKDLAARGETVLGGYYDQYHATWRTHVLSEFSIAGVLLAPDVRLTGKIDKLELIDERPGTVVVVDYKTGKPKSRNDIEGKTKSPGSGDIKRQLVFYRLLLDRYEDGKYRMEAADVDFIEPTEAGQYKKERFTIEDAEVQELHDTVLRVSNEILEAAFWDKGCGEKDCEFCALRGLMA